MKYYQSQLLIFFAASLVFGGCNAKKQKAGMGIDGQTEFFEINFEQCLGKERQMFLSEISDMVTYLVLKTPDDVVITSIQNVISYSDYLILNHREGVSLFHKDGSFIRNIGTRGQ